MTSLPGGGTIRLQSLSARRAWIEIWHRLYCGAQHRVALRKESVDRNIDNWTWARGMWVALRKESVDRNEDIIVLCKAGYTSLSARRAWIEIVPPRWQMSAAGWSLSARRAWIEIQPMRGKTDEEIVALRKESVDRNCFSCMTWPQRTCRSPQGERG